MNNIVKSLDLSYDLLDGYIDELLGLSKINDIGVNKKQQKRVQEEILTSWVKRKLEPVLLHLLFNQDNYRPYTRPQLCKELSFTRSLILPYFISKRAKVRIDKILFDRDLTKQTTDLNLINEAKRFLVTLEERLGQSKSFFPPSDKETLNYADVVIYIYLSRLLTQELTDRNLRNHLKVCKNLMAFLSHFALSNHLSDPTVETATIIEAEDENKVTAFTVPILVTAMACLLFASAKGLLGTR